VRAPSCITEKGFFVEAFRRVLANRPEHGQPPGAVDLAADHEALADERQKRLHDRDVGESVDARRDGFDRVDPRRWEHREQTEERSLDVVQQLLAPSDSAAERPLAGRKVSRARGNDVEMVAEAGKELTR
jgi:hypothetical protein